MRYLPKKHFFFFVFSFLFLFSLSSVDAKKYKKKSRKGSRSSALTAPKWSDVRLDISVQGVYNLFIANNDVIPKSIGGGLSARTSIGSLSRWLESKSRLASALEPIMLGVSFQFMSTSFSFSNPDAANSNVQRSIFGSDLQIDFGYSFIVQDVYRFSAFYSPGFYLRGHSADVSSPNHSYSADGSLIFNSYNSLGGEFNYLVHRYVSLNLSLSYKVYQGASLAHGIHFGWGASFVII